MTYYTVTLRLEGAPAAAVAVEWTNHSTPVAASWEPCLQLAQGIWRFSSREPAAAAAPHRRAPGLFADLAIRYRLDPAGPWSAAAAPRKSIVIEEGRADGTFEPLQVQPVLLAVPTLLGSAEIGSELAVEPGLWSGVPAPALAFQWRRDDTALPGATARSYLLGPQDDGCEIVCAVAATNLVGEAVAAAGPLRARRAPPRRVDTLPEEVFDEGTGPQAVETAFAFAGDALVFTAEGAPIDPATGVLSVPTDAPVAGAVLRVTATNSGGAATADMVYTVEAAVSPTTIDPGNVTFLPYWVDPAKRTLLAAEVEVAGVGARDALQWRIDTARVEGAWQDCPVTSGDRRALGIAARPAHLPGDHPLGYFDDDEERFAIRFRKRIGGLAWSESSPKLRLDPPSPFQPSVTAATAAELRAAVIAATDPNRPILSHYVIHLTAPISSPGNTLQFSNRAKQGGALVIRSANRTDPPRISGFTGTAVQFADCKNFVVDRLNIWNDQDALARPNDPLSTLRVGNGSGIMVERSLHFSITNCLVRRTAIGINIQESQYYSVCYNEISENGADNIRIYRSSRDSLYEANYVHDQLIDQGLTLTTRTPLYHPDSFQADPVNNTTDGYRRVRWLRNCIIGNGNGTYLQGILVSVTSSAATWPTRAVEDCIFADNYIEVTKPIALKVTGGRRVLIERCIGRKIDSPHYSAGAELHLGAPMEAITIRDVAFPRPGPYFEDAESGFTAQQMRNTAVISGWIDTRGISAPLWPSWWPEVAPGEDRRFAHKPGPDAYRS